MPRFYNRSWRRGFYRRSVYSKQKSGNRYFNISFPVETVVSLTVAPNQNFTNVLRTVPWRCRIGTAQTDANVAAYAASLMESKAYRIYAGLYDSMKINSVSLKFSIATTIGEGGIPGIRCYTSWDRDLMANENVINEDDLLNGPESQVVTFINNSKAKFTRYNRAMDLQERTTFHDCSVVYAENDYRVDTFWMSNSAATGRSVGYSPSLSLVMQCSNTTATTRTIPIQIQGVYNVTFRNPKYGLSAAAPNRSFGEVDSIAEGKKVEEDEEMEEEPVLKKKKVQIVEENDDEEESDELLNPLEDESQEPVTVSKPVLVKKAGKKSSG